MSGQGPHVGTNHANINNNQEKIWRSLLLSYSWLSRMVVPQTGRLAAEYDPVRREYLTETSSVRELSNLLDIFKLSSLCNGHDFDGLLKNHMNSIYQTLLVDQNNHTNHDNETLQEKLKDVVWIAKFLKLLCHAEFEASIQQLEHERKKQLICAFADLLIARQRRDGSYELSQDGYKDGDGNLNVGGDESEAQKEKMIRREGTKEFVAVGEVMLALLISFERSGDVRYLQSVARSLPFYEASFLHRRKRRRRLPHQDGEVEEEENDEEEEEVEELLVYFASYQTQVVKHFIELLSRKELIQQDETTVMIRQRAREWCYRLQDRITSSSSSFSSTATSRRTRHLMFDELRQFPQRYSTLEVAFGVEGLLDGLEVVLSEERERKKQELDQQMYIDGLNGVQVNGNEEEEDVEFEAEAELRRRKRRYINAINEGVCFLLGIQRRGGVVNGVTGQQQSQSASETFALGGYSFGFGLRTQHQTQRVEVTSRVVSCFMKLLPFLTREQHDIDQYEDEDHDEEGIAASNEMSGGSLFKTNFQEIYPQAFRTWIPRR